jgi:hypothetical protein
MSDFPMDIGLPDLSAEDIEKLGEQCEEEVTNYLLQILPKKSIESMSVSCILDLRETLEIEIDLDISQKFDTGHDVDELLELATQHGIQWLESRLREMKVG